MNFLKNVKSFFSLLINRKIIFSLPAKNKCAVFDKPGFDLISKLINRKTSLIYARKEKVYLSILLLSLLKYLFKWKPLFYYVEYVKFIQPKICISFIDNSSVFFSLKSFCPEIIFIVIQNGTRSYHNDLSRLLFLKKDNKYSVDYGFYFGKYIKNYVSKIIKINIKTYNFGSIRNNSVACVKRRKKGILFISEFREKNSLPTKREQKFLIENKYWRKPDLIVLENLNRFCKKNKIKLTIRGSNKKINNNEINFYKQHINNLSARFMPFYSKTNIYSSLDRYKLAVFLSSTLGYESIARGNKSICFSGLRAQYVSNFLNSKKELGYNFGWPKKFSKSGICWSDKANYKDFEKKINQILSVKKKNWEIFLKNYRKDILFYDKENSKLKSHLKKIIKRHI